MGSNKVQKGPKKGPKRAQNGLKIEKISIFSFGSKCSEKRHPKSNVATIVFDKFGSKALSLFGVAFIRKTTKNPGVLPLFGSCLYLTEKDFGQK